MSENPKGRRLSIALLGAGISLLVAGCPFGKQDGLLPGDDGQSFVGEDACNARARNIGFGGLGATRISWEIQTQNCSDSRGSFGFDVSTLDSDGDSRSMSLSRSWVDEDGNSEAFIQSESVLLEFDEILSRVTPARIEVCTCIAEEK